MSKKILKVRKFDAAEYLDSPEAIAAYLSEALSSGDTDEMLEAIGTIARAKGMSAIAKETGLGRESLYKALRPGSRPEFGTIAKVIKALGIRLEAAA
jgi:probable addiction module antidote protein